jgi:hypothetical protein
MARDGRSGIVRGIVENHGHRGQYGGVWVDHSLGGVVISQWTDDVEAHEAAIRPRLPRCHPVLFREVRFSEDELRLWQDRIVADIDWMAGIPASWQGTGADITTNQVRVRISSANPDAPGIIEAHFGAPDGMIRVESDGTGAHLLPSGTVVGRILTADGRVPKDTGSLLLDSGAPDDPPGYCGGGDIGFGFGDDGTFEYGCKVGRRTIHVRDASGEPSRIVASVVVDVPANGRVEVEIRLPEDWQPRP